MEKCYPEAGAERRFKKPSINMHVECVGHIKDPTAAILRLHFFDKQMSSYSSYANMWSATSSSELGSVGKTVRLARSIDKMAKSPPNPEPKNWEELCEGRANRFTNHKKVYDDQVRALIPSFC